MARGRKQGIGFLSEARQLARNGFYREALQLYQNLWSQDSGHQEALYGVAACLFRLGNLQQAEAHVRMLLEKARAFPKAERLLQLIVETRRQRGDHRRPTLLEGCQERYEDEDLRGSPVEGQPGQLP